ncbi:LOW QUALITY PROTEIN: cilium assembly protein DZIP1L [Podargus strigoides]
MGFLEPLGLGLWTFSADLPQPVPGAVGLPGASPGLSIPVGPFHFQPCQASVDWNHFSTIEVEQVARDMNVAMLQEHLSSITFCNCCLPTEPILLKVLRMAQLSAEHVIFCQEYLQTSLAKHAQCLEATHAELALTQQQGAEQVAQPQRAKEVSRRWQKLTAMQQLLKQTSPNTYCECCYRAFMNDSLLEAQMRCCHTEATEVVKSQEELADRTLAHSTCGSLSFAERLKMKQVEELNPQVQEVQQQLEMQREVKKLHREQEMEGAHQQEEEGRRDLARWKEEMTKLMHSEVDGLRQLFLEAFKDVASRSSAVEKKLQDLQAREVMESNLEALQAKSWAELQGKWERMAAQGRGDSKYILTMFKSSRSFFAPFN